MGGIKDNNEQRLDLVIAGTKDAVMMVESEAYELSEQEMLGAVKFGHEQMAPVIEMIIDLAKSAAKVPFNFEYTTNFKGVFRYINLEIYKMWIKLGKIPINREFLIKVRKDFDSRPKSKIKDSMFLNLPSMKKFETQFPTNVSLDNQIRTVRRGIKEVEKTIENVSKGKFP